MSRKILVICTYCGYEAPLDYYDMYRMGLDEQDCADLEICSKCQSTQVRIKKRSENINYYQGCPAFPEDDRDE